jgi:hypothetical protein
MTALADLETILREAARDYRADGEERHAETLFNVLTTIHEVAESTAVLFMARC